MSNDKTEFNDGDPVVFITHDRDGTRELPVGTRATYRDTRQPLESGSVARVTLEDGTVVTAWTDRLAHREAEPETELVTIRDTKELKVGDVVTRAEDFIDHWAQVKRVKPAPAPKVGYGKAIAAGARRKGFVSKSGHFYYLDADDIQRTAYKGHWADFVPED